MKIVAIMGSPRGLRGFEIMAFPVQTKQVEWPVAFEYWNTNWKQ